MLVAYATLSFAITSPLARPALTARPAPAVRLMLPRSSSSSSSWPIAVAPMMNIPVDVTVASAISGRLEAIACSIPVFIALFATRSSSGITSITKMARSKTPQQVSSKWGTRVFYGDAIVYLSRIIYHVRRGFPVSCWSELFPLLAQNLICFALLRRAKISPGPGKKRQWLTIGLDAGLLVTLSVAMATLPARLLPLLCLWSIPLSVSSYSLQIFEAYRMGSAPQSKRATAVLLRWFGSLVRVLTTTTLLRGDWAAMSSHAVGFAGCSILLLQRYVVEKKGPTRRQTRMALYSQILGYESPPPPSGVLRAIDNTLHAWRSLGGFGAAVPPSRDALDFQRRAFDSLDENGDGQISQDELTRAVLQASKERSSAMSDADAKALTQRMMLAADVDGDGTIDFDEYRAIVTKRAGGGATGQGGALAPAQPQPQGGAG